MFIATSVLVASQAPEERHMAPLPTAKFAYMPLLRSLAGYWDARGYKHGAPPELGGGRAVRDRRF